MKQCIILILLLIGSLSHADKITYYSDIIALNKWLELPSSSGLVSLYRCDETLGGETLNSENLLAVSAAHALKDLLNTDGYRRRLYITKEGSIKLRDIVKLDNNLEMLSPSNAVITCDNSFVNN